MRAKIIADIAVVGLLLYVYIWWILNIHFTFADTWQQGVAALISAYSVAFCFGGVVYALIKWIHKGK